MLAQTTTTEEPEEVYELSPFEVSADSQIGYLATQTLSGTRMRSELGDVASSIDVLTDEFLSDVGATTMYEALDFVGNVETWDKSGGAINENENQVWFASPYMARGFLTTSVTTDFFDQGKAAVDFYNKDNFTVARGPNAILFGIGSPGGIVNSSRKRAQWGKDLTDLQFRVDNYGSVRTTFDISRELVEDKLAVRAALLYDDTQEFLKPAGHNRKAVYGTLTYRPTSKTTLTVTGEEGKEDRVFRYTTTMYDGITPWINAGKPTYNGFNNTPPIDQSPGTGLDRERREALLISGQPAIPILNWQNMARTERFEIAGHPDINRIRATGYTEDTAIWDIEDTQLTGSSRERHLDWQNVAAFLTQELFVPELQLELAFNRTKTDYLISNAFGQFFLQMDANELLPDGTANPNFGVPYVESDRTEVTGEINVAETYRATLSYSLDLNDREVLGMGLGRYNLMGLYEDHRVNSLFAGFRRAYVDPIAGFPGSISNAQNRVRTRTYVDTYLTPDGANVRPYYVEDFTPIDRDGAQDAWYRYTSPRDINDKRESMVLAVQAYLWETEQNYERIILTAGYRKDRQVSQRKEYSNPGGVYEGALWRGSPWDLKNETRADFWDGTYNYGTWGEPSLTDEPTKTYSAMFKVTKDLAFFYNYSDVLISASSLFTDIYDEFVEGTVGETEDIGVRWTTLEGKVVTSLTFFETSAQNQRENNVRTLFTPFMTDIWETIDPNGEIHKGFNERYVTLRNDTSEGLEFNLTANLTPNWRTRLSVSQIETIITSRLPIVDRYLAEFSPLWESNRSMDLNTALQVLPDYITVGDAIDRVNREIADLHALEGTVPQAQREWKVVFNTNYNFRDGPLDGVGIGGGFRWQTSDIIGYAYDENNIVDPDRPFDGEEILDVTANVSYTTRIMGQWVRFQLNVRNLLDEGGTFPVSAVDDLTGNPWYGRQQVREPRSFLFTTTIKF